MFDKLLLETNNTLPRQHSSFFGNKKIKDGLLATVNHHPNKLEKSIDNSLDCNNKQNDNKKSEKKSIQPIHSNTKKINERLYDSSSINRHEFNKRYKMQHEKQHEKQYEKQKAYKESFCPDMLILRTRCSLDERNGMFITSTFELKCESCFIVLSYIPYTDAGTYIMLNIVNDDSNDISIRKIAFALLAKLLEIKINPLTTCKLPLYNEYKSKVETLLTNCNFKSQDNEFYMTFKTNIISKLPVNVLAKDKLNSILREMERHFDGPLNLDRNTSWLLPSLYDGLIDSSKRQQSVARNYYQMISSKQPSDSEIQAKENNLDYKVQFKDDASIDSNDFIDSLNQVAYECMLKITSDPNWLDSSAKKCIILLFVTTIRNGIRDKKSWPSVQELQYRMNEVRKIIGS